MSGSRSALTKQSHMARMPPQWGVATGTKHERMTAYGSQQTTLDRIRNAPTERRNKTNIRHQVIHSFIHSFIQHSFIHDINVRQVAFLVSILTTNIRRIKEHLAVNIHDENNVRRIENMASYYGVVYGSPCGRPEKVCWFILS